MIIMIKYMLNKNQLMRELVFLKRKYRNENNEKQTELLRMMVQLSISWQQWTRIAERLLQGRL